MILASNQRNLCYVFTFLFISFVMPTQALALATTPTWQGPYIGAYLGGGSGNDHLSTHSGSVTTTSYFTTPADINAVNQAGTSTNRPITVIGGIQAGHDWAWQQLVYGVVFDYSTLPLSSSKTKNIPYPDNANQFAVHTSMRTNWLFTLRGRLGYQTMLHAPSFFYVTGGMAMTQLHVNNDFNDNSALMGTGRSNLAQNQIGWTAGLGVEMLAFSHTSVDLEYLYINIPSIKTTGAISNSEAGFGIPAQSSTNSFATTAKFHSNIVKIGLNYRFDE